MLDWIPEWVSQNLTEYMTPVVSYFITPYVVAVVQSLLTFLVLAAFYIGLAVLVGLLVYMYMTTEPEPSLYRSEKEKTYLDPEENERKPFPSLFEPSSLDLSVVVPAYNEQERMPVMLDEAVDYLKDFKNHHKSFTFEIIVVDDGSKDKTTATAMQYSMKHGADTIRVLTLEKNRGKGGAIRRGVLSARGKRILFADADGATTFEDLSKLQSEMDKLVKSDEDEAIVCGSRAHLEKDAIAQRSFFRTLLMKGFHFLVWVMCVKGVRDTQCGFKLMTRTAARRLFTNLHVERWAFDVELLYIAQTLGMIIGEVAVRWQEIEGSKLVPVWSWLQMGRDLLFIRLRYVFGLWTLTEMPHTE